MHISYQLSHLPSRHRRVNNEAASDERHIHWRVGQRANLPRARGSTGTWETAAPCYAGFKHRRRTKRGNREKWPVVHSSPHRIDIWEAGFSQNFWELSRRLFFSRSRKFQRITLRCIMTINRKLPHTPDTNASIEVAARGWVAYRVGAEPPDWSLVVAPAW